MSARSAASAAPAPVAATAARAFGHPNSCAQIEVVASRPVALFGLAFGAQTLPLALAQREYLHELWFWLVGTGLFCALIVAVVASVAKRFVKTANFVVLGVFLIAEVTWPLGLRDELWTSVDQPWLWFLIVVATSAAAIALPIWLATFYLLLVPILYGVIRTSPSGGSIAPDIVVFDVVYVLILGAAVLIIVTMLRAAAAPVDAAQATALARYVIAVREHATEVERVQVDAIVHDSVLATLRSAARASTQEAKARATTMAANAIGQLQFESAPSIDEAFVSVGSLGARLAHDASTLSAAIDVRHGDLGDGSIPARVADAIQAAARQAMVNSLQHATDDDVAHWLSASVLPEGGLLIEVGDTGSGFVVADVPVEGLGVRLSIVERITNVGGEVEIDSVIGEGTAIRIRWPAQPAPNAERAQG